MADMEKFLLEKLNKAINDAKWPGFSSILKECSKLEKLIEVAAEPLARSNSILKECSKLRKLIEGKQLNTDAELSACSNSILEECSKLEKMIKDKQQKTADAELSEYSNSILKECSRLKKLLEDKQQNTCAELSECSDSILKECSRLKKSIEDKQQNTVDAELSECSNSIRKECSRLNKLIEDKQEKTADAELLGGSNSILKECSKLKKLIEDKKPNTGAADEATRRENLYYLNNVVAERRAVLTKHNQYSPAAQITLNQLTKSLKKIRKELEEHIEVPARKDEASKDKEKTDDEAARKDEASRNKEKADKKHRGLENPYQVDLSKIYGIKYKSEAMERLLVRKETESKGFRAIGVVGMTGVGKTTFCQVAFNNEEVKKHFLPRIWVEISNQPDTYEDYKKEVVKSFLRSLGFEDKVVRGIESNGLGLLLLALRKQLQGKRYLVVLDDIWHLNEWFKDFCSSLADDGSNGDEEYKLKLAYGLPKGSGGTVIVTSRSEKWAVSMVGERNLQRLTPLEDEESLWNIYLDTRREKGYVLDKGEEKMHDKIVKRCAGLPLIAKMLGETVVKNFEDEKLSKRAGIIN